MIRGLGAFVLVALVAYALAAVAATQSVLSRLAEMGIEVGLAQRLAATGHDLIGMGSSYLPIIALGLAIAFAAAALLARWLRAWRTALYALAGFAAIVAAHLILNLSFGITPIAAARTLPGLLIQGLAGAIGGLVFVRTSSAFRKNQEFDS